MMYAFSGHGAINKSFYLQLHGLVAKAIRI